METYEEELKWLMERFKIDEATAEKMLAVIGEYPDADEDDDETVIVNNG